MLDAMHASNELAPLASHFCSTHKWIAGVTVAQLMNNFPFARVNKPPVNMLRIALSSGTTVMTISESAVTALRSDAATQLSSRARDSSAGPLISKIALMVKPASLRCRAMLAPMRPTPTIPIVFVINFGAAVLLGFGFVFAQSQVVPDMPLRSILAKTPKL